MVSFPNAKINLGLNILRKRPDGFHDIESCFYPVGWHDTLEIIPSDQLKFSSVGFDIPGDNDSNLCLKAFNLLNQEFDLQPVEIVLLKNIPIGAGLGGGSADAAFALKMLNEYFKLNLNDSQLEEYAGKLGSDCPFFIKNQPIIASDTGTTFSETTCNLAGKFITIIYPNLHVSTATAYSNVSPSDQSQSVKEIVELPIEKWRDNLKNDFEASLETGFPIINEIKNSLYNEGAIYASMTGSGSAVYGIFDNLESIQDYTEYNQWKGELS